MKTIITTITALLTIGLAAPATADIIPLPPDDTSYGQAWGTFPSRYNWTPPTHTVKGECKRHGHKHGHKHHKRHGHKLCFVIN